MPELAEVAYYAKQWATGLGQAVKNVEIQPKARVFRDMEQPGRLALLIKGSRYKEWRTHGKQMFFRFGNVWLSGHLGMTGKLWVAPKNYIPEKHDHLVFRQAKQQLVFTDPRMFGHWQNYDSAAFDMFWASLPPEVLDSRFTKSRLSEFLKRRARSPLKAVLLMQETFPGVGNWMADEILWRCQYDPRRRAGTLSESETAQLWTKLRLVCRQAMRVIATDWNTPPNTWLFNHRWKDGGTCPCGAPLVRETVGGRTTCWCPTCQEGE